MHGPTYARIPSPSISRTTLATISAIVPRQPEWTIATSPASSPMSATGTQSATATTSENPPSSVTSASASPARPGLLTRTTPSPATWRTQADSRPSIASRMRSWFSVTASGSSPTFREIFKESNGGLETPPLRVKNHIWAPSGSGLGATYSTPLTEPKTQASLSRPSVCTLFSIRSPPHVCASIVLSASLGILEPSVGRSPRSLLLLSQLWASCRGGFFWGGGPFRAAGRKGHPGGG